ncbi:MAG: FtsW/RodA/SpoVE family cell cycle protein [Spirulina sp. SIO3F2]|nr:FtsW/RodA/SpoVE family cell cycle protein [Spirulina sp. SIO3F2]
MLKPLTHQLRTLKPWQWLRYMFPFFDGDVLQWSLEARLLRWLTFVWLFIGLAILFSASYPVADAEYNDGLYYFRRQLLWVAVGLVGFSVTIRSPLRYFLNLGRLLMPLFTVMIVLTLVPGLGTTVNGATRWITIAFVPLQPSELIKPFLILQSAVVFGRWSNQSWLTRLLWLGLFSLLLGAILLQPNLSTAALCGIALWLLAVAAELPWLPLLITASSGVILAALSISIHDYQRRRVLSFLDPWSDPRQDGYQLIQSLLAIGSGGTWGAGFGLSQQKLFYLPIQYTDFIFSVFAEELGFLGGILLLLLLGSYATIALVVALRAHQSTHQLVAVGCTFFLVGQALVNIAVATGLLPTTGLPFPFLSYGGSSMIASLAIAGLLVRVARETNEAEVVALRRPHAMSAPKAEPNQ